MKKLFISLLALISFSALSGELHNRKTGEKVSFTLDEVNQEVLIHFELNKQNSEQILKLKEFDKNKSRKDRIYWRGIGFDDGVIGGSSRDVIVGVSNGRYTPAAFIMLPVGIALDVMTLPIVLPFKFLNPNSVHNIRRNGRLIQKLILNEDAVKTVRKARFNRLLKYLGYKL